MSTLNKPPLVIIHPLVLISVVDHYNRIISKTQQPRVVGALLGERKPDGVIDITNSYALPFEEDPKDQNIWYLDHIYNETLFELHRKININEKIVGWYSTGSRFKPNDIQINQIFYKYTSTPIFVIIDVHQFDPLSLPTEAYTSVDEISKSGEIIQNFVHIPSTVQAFEPEEIGVEQLLREINNVDTQSLSAKAEQKINGVKGMNKKIAQIQQYLTLIQQGKVKPNQLIINNLQEILNYLPNLGTSEVVQAFTTKNNDNMLTIYLASLMRSIIAYHNLINNQAQQDKKVK
ncbi:unnamed protein product [Paramecium sonneborni]|uniref:MPN domain-containing protein n=1 Tax=Paramecium sonneborni TaxID=65129 RepID=A0A8S1RER2_9CILI|nr:unnamed protein product [Paramecium sonneborni]